MKARRLPGHREPYWVIDREHPSERDLRKVARRPFLHVLQLPRGETSLGFLEPIIGDLERLIVTDWSCTDSRILERAVRLVELDLWTAEAQAIDFGELVRLASVAFEWQPELASALALPSLRSATVLKPPLDILNYLGPAIERLRLNQAGRLNKLGGGPATLRELELHGCHAFDAMSLAQYVNLRVLEITGVRRLSGVTDLSQKIRLERLNLEDVGLDDEDQLHRLRVTTLLGIGRPFLDPRVTAMLRRAPTQELILPP